MLIAFSPGTELHHYPFEDIDVMKDKRRNIYKVVILSKLNVGLNSN